MRARPILLAAIALLVPLVASAPLLACSAAQIDVRIAATPIPFDWRNPAHETFGRLTFRGGLEFAHDRDAVFGGLSGLLMSENGRRFAAVTDRGRWVSGALRYAKDRLAGVDAILIAPLRDRRGRPLDGKRDQDAESIASADGLFLDKSVLVSFERNHRIARYGLGEDGDFGNSTPLPLPAAVSGMSANQGLEAVGLFPQGTPLAGTLIAIAERKLDNARNHSGWLIKDGRATAFTLARSDAFEITDLAILPDGNVIILERRYAPIFGMSMRLRLIESTRFASGEIVDGEALLTADNRYSIDNMEGLAIHREADGGIVLTIVSDNNFSKSQRTLLLQFRLD